VKSAVVRRNSTASEIEETGIDTDVDEVFGATTVLL
jgi:hypothetical protein